MRKRDFSGRKSGFSCLYAEIRIPKHNDSSSPPSKTVVRSSQYTEVNAPHDNTERVRRCVPWRITFYIDDETIILLS